MTWFYFLLAFLTSFPFFCENLSLTERYWANKSHFQMRKGPRIFSQKRKERQLARDDQPVASQSSRWKSTGWQFKTRISLGSCSVLLQLSFSTY